MKFKSLRHLMVAITLIPLLVTILACGSEVTPEVANAPDSRRAELIPLSSSRSTYVTEATERAKTVIQNNEALFWRQPYIRGLGIGLLKDATGNYTDVVGIIVSVNKKVPQKQLLPWFRIPKEIDGVPIEIREETTTWSTSFGQGGG